MARLPPAAAIIAKPWARSRARPSAAQRMATSIRVGRGRDGRAGRTKRRLRAAMRGAGCASVEADRTGPRRAALTGVALGPPAPPRRVEDRSCVSSYLHLQLLERASRVPSVRVAAWAEVESDGALRAILAAARRWLVPRRRPEPRRGSPALARRRTRLRYTEPLCSEIQRTPLALRYLRSRYALCTAWRRRCQPSP